jgi:hypothetical protein
MAFLERDRIINDIRGVITELSSFLKTIEWAPNNYLSFDERSGVLFLADQYHRATNDYSFLWLMLRKLDDEALITMYKDCRTLANKYYFTSRHTLTYDEVIEFSSVDKVPDYTNQNISGKISFLLLQFFTGGNADKILQGVPNVNGWLNLTDEIYFQAALLPIQTVNRGAMIIKYAAIFGGNVPISGAAKIIQDTTDYAQLGVKIAHAWSVDTQAAWNDVMTDVAGMVIGAFISTVVEDSIANVKVRVSTKNGGFYQLGRRGRMSDLAGFYTNLSQDLAPELGQDLTSKIMDDVKSMLLTNN